MSSTVIAKNVQIGADGTASNNFTIFQPATPDGTLRIGNGNTGITSSAVALTSAGNVGIGTSSPGAGSGLATKLDVVTPNGTATRIGLAQSGINSAGITIPASVGGLGFEVGATERMRIGTNGNVGIGTTAGTTTVSSGLAINNATAANYPGLEIQTAGVTRMYFNANNSASYIASVGTNPLVFYTGGSERMRIDSSGNVGIGTSSTNRLSLTYDGGTGAATIGPNSTGGSTYLTLGTSNAGTYAERARIDSSGNVGIGKTPSQKLDVAGRGDFTIGSPGIIQNWNDTSSNNIQVGTTTDGLYISNTANKAIWFATNSTEQARITSTGLFQFNSGYGSVATAYGCRAWVNFNGQGTVAIRASGNVSSITDGGTGTYTVNFTTAMPDANYAVTGTCGVGGYNGGNVVPQASDADRGTNTTSATLVRTLVDGSGTGTGPFDAAYVYVAIFR